MKKCLFFIFLLSVIYAPAQEKVSAKDSIIYLEEVVLTGKYKKAKYKKVKTKGKKPSTFSFIEGISLVSLIDNIPPGKINTLKFYFNNRESIVFFGEKRSIVFGENFFRLLILSVDSNGLPSRSIIAPEIKFKVDRKKENIELDLSNLNLIDHSALYIGIELLERNNEGEDLNFSIDYREYKAGKTYFKPPHVNDWLKVFGGGHLRMELMVQVN